MSRLLQLVFSCLLLWGPPAWAQDQLKLHESRGELLYSNQCRACHSEKIHWRAQKRVTDWRSLKREVRRWQGSIGLNWTEEEITDVAHYLNAAHYHF